MLTYSRIIVNGAIVQRNTGSTASRRTSFRNSLDLSLAVPQILLLFFLKLHKARVIKVSKHDYVQFLQSFIRQPRQVGSVLPSSRFLAGKMVENVAWNQVHAVAELGAGTGAITRMIHKKITNNTKVLLFEMDASMRQQLQSSYPAFTCHADARCIVQTMKRHNIEQLDCVISGLPFFNFSPELRQALLNQVLQALKPGGRFIAFQYSLQMKATLSSHFRLEHIHFVPCNFPPAFVYTCVKKEALDQTYCQRSCSSGARFANYV